MISCKNNSLSSPHLQKHQPKGEKSFEEGEDNTEFDEEFDRFDDDEAEKEDLYYDANDEDEDFYDYDDVEDNDDEKRRLEFSLISTLHLQSITADIITSSASFKV